MSWLTIAKKNRAMSSRRDFFKQIACALAVAYYPNREKYLPLSAPGAGEILEASHEKQVIYLAEVYLNGVFKDGETFHVLSSGRELNMKVGLTPSDYFASYQSRLMGMFEAKTKEAVEPGQIVSFNSDGRIAPARDGDKIIGIVSRISEVKYTLKKDSSILEEGEDA